MPFASARIEPWPSSSKMLCADERKSDSRLPVMGILCYALLNFVTSIKRNSKTQFFNSIPVYIVLVMNYFISIVAVSGLLFLSGVTADSCSLCSSNQNIVAKANVTTSQGNGCGSQLFGMYWPIPSQWGESDSCCRYLPRHSWFQLHCLL